MNFELKRAKVRFFFEICKDGGEREGKKSIMQVCFSSLSPRLKVPVGYSWGVHGIFTEYSWDIRMYRVCVGYVSGMYRECVEIYGVRKAKMILKRRMKKIIQKLSEIRVCTTKIAVY